MTLTDAIATANELNALFLSMSQTDDIAVFDVLQKAFLVRFHEIDAARKSAKGACDTFLMGLGSHCQFLVECFDTMRDTLQGFDSVSVTRTADGKIVLVSDVLEAIEEDAPESELKTEFKEGFQLFSGRRNRATGELALTEDEITMHGV
jgi:hypothetical protein